MFDRRFPGRPGHRRFGRRKFLRAGSAVTAAALLPGTASGASLPATHPEGTATTMKYHLEGRLLEVCTCNTLCPCWVGDDPDGGTCDAALAWKIDAGTIEGVDVSDLVLGLTNHIPGNIFAGNWQVVLYVDDRATADQEAAMLKVWTGELGGPIADLIGLYGEVIAVERATIGFDVVDGRGTFTIGEHVTAEMAPFQGPTGAATSLHESVFSTIPGSPAFVGKASHYNRDESRHGLANVNLEGHNAIQGLFTFEA
jgi:hypothetical protein